MGKTPMNFGLNPICHYREITQLQSTAAILDSWKTIMFYDVYTLHFHFVMSSMVYMFYSLKYVTVDEAIRSLVDLVPGALMESSPLPDLVVSSDASGSHGFRAPWRTEWFCTSWFFLHMRLCIASLELVPNVVAAHIWGCAWFRLRVQFLCDNIAVVSVLNSGTSKSPDVMHLLRLPTLEACRHNFVFSAAYTPGRDNSAADALSRLRLQEFRRLAPHANQLSRPIPPSLLSPLVPPAWSTSVLVSWLRVWLHPLVVFTLLVSGLTSNSAPVFSCRTFRHQNGCWWYLRLGLTDLGAPDPTSGATRLARLLRGIRRSCTSPAFIGLPITDRLMLVFQSALAVPRFDHVMVWAACCTAFFEFLRVSEFTCSDVFFPFRHLALDDIEWDAEGHYHLFLHTSKTDPFHHGCTILIGPSGHQICPVAAMSRYLAIRGYIPAPLFICANGTPLSPSIVNAWLRSILKAAGVPGNYSSHSFRIGAATSAALAGGPDHVIKILGRWSSDCYLRYIRTPPHVILQFIVSWLAE